MISYSRHVHKPAAPPRAKSSHLITMKARLAIIPLSLALLLTGCVITPAPRQGTMPTWRLQPPLNPDVALQIYVQDARPAVEIEKKPSTDYLYSGTLFAVDGNALTVGMALRDLIVKYGGARNIHLADTTPSDGTAIVFTLEHWYSRTELKPEKPPIFVTGEFSGTLAIKRDGKVLATQQIRAVGTPSVVDTYIIFDSEKRQTPGLIVKAMERTANFSEQKGYAEIMNVLQDDWHLFQ